MKSTIETPWSIGDKCWAIYSTTERSTSFCNECEQHKRKEKHVEKILECEIDGIEITTYLNKPNRFFYRVGFNTTGEGFDYSMGVSDVWATKEEAEKFLTNRYKQYDGG